MSGQSDAIHLGDCGFPESSLIWLLLSREISCGMCDLLGTISGVSISSPNVVGAGVAASIYVSGSTTAGTFIATVPYFVSRTWMCLAASLHPSCVNLSSLICMCHNSLCGAALFGDYPHHAARFIMFSQLAQFCILFIIILIIATLLIIGTGKITQTVSNSLRHLLNCFFGLSGCQSHFLTISHIFLLVHNRSLSVFNSLGCHSSVSFQIILDQFLYHFIA